MKKKIAVMLSLALCFMLSISFVACGKNKHKAKSGWEFDSAQHWHECSTKGHDDKLDAADHTFGDWTVKTPADYGTEGEETAVCSVCKYEKTRATSALDAKDNTVALKKGVAVSKTYDAKTIAFSASDLTTNGDGAVTFEYKKKGSDNDFSATAPKDAGTYEVKASVAATAEWKACETTFDYTIDKYELTQVYGHHTKEYDGTKYIVISGVTTPFGDNLNVQLYFEFTSAGNRASSSAVIDGSNKSNYRIDESKITAEIVEKKLSGLKFTVTEDELDLSKETNKIYRTIKTGVREEEIEVGIEFNPTWLKENDELNIHLTIVDSGSCRIWFKVAYKNYEFVTEKPIGTLTLVRSAA